MEWINEQLNDRRQNGLLRGLHPASKRCSGKIYFGRKEYWDFSSNDYLGLSNHPEIIKAASRALKKYGFGSSGSRLLSGDLDLHHQLEEKTAEFKGKPRALVYNSGYQANLGIISALANKDCAVFLDKLSHASLIDAALLSKADFFRFRHNDLNHLSELLKKERNKYKNALIVTETVFSMDGDCCPLADLVKIKNQYDCLLMVDEAHAGGVFGKKLSGLVEQEGLTAEVDIIMGTFSKALGGFGAYVAAEGELIDYLINFSRSFIYSTSLPAAVIAGNLAALNLLGKNVKKGKDLLIKAERFRRALAAKGLDVIGNSQIVPVIVGESGKTSQIAKKLQAKGYWSLAIRPPTVPPNQARLRFSLTVDHPKNVLDKFLIELDKALL